MKYVLCNADTDSISVRKPDNSFITPEERAMFLEHLNDIFPEFINFADDGYFPSFIVLKAKNYIMLDDKNKLTLKGSSLKSATLEPMLKEFLKEIIDSILADRNDFVDIYHKYIKMIGNIKDIKPWCTKKTLSATTYKSTRKNETNIIDAIAHTEYIEGDKVYLFYREDGSLCLAEHFNGDYDKDTFYEKLYKATKRFDGVIDLDIFLNYSLKKNKKLLEKLHV